MENYCEDCDELTENCTCDICEVSSDYEDDDYCSLCDEPYDYCICYNDEYETDDDEDYED